MKRVVPLLLLALASAGYGAPVQAPAAPALQVGVASAQAISVTITGPESPSGWATWEAVVYGGSPPYQYTWMWTASDGYAEGEFLHANFYDDGFLHVTVTDARGRTSSDYMQINPVSSP